MVKALNGENATSGNAVLTEQCVTPPPPPTTARQMTSNDSNLALEIAQSQVRIHCARYFDCARARISHLVSSPAERSLCQLIPAVHCEISQRAGVRYQYCRTNYSDHAFYVLYKPAVEQRIHCDWYLKAVYIGKQTWEAQTCRILCQGIRVHNFMPSRTHNSVWNLLSSSSC